MHPIRNFFFCKKKTEVLKENEMVGPTAQVTQCTVCSAHPNPSNRLIQAKIYNVETEVAIPSEFFASNPAKKDTRASHIPHAIIAGLCCGQLRPGLLEMSHWPQWEHYSQLGSH